jgi:hypothetical protein
VQCRAEHFLEQFWGFMKFTESPVAGRSVVTRQQEAVMPLHMQGMLMTTQFHACRPQHPGMAMHRTASLEMLNNAEFEEKRAFIASTLSLNDLLKPQDYRGTPSPSQASQFQPGTNTYSNPGQHAVPGNFQHNGYVVPQSLMKQQNQQQLLHNPSLHNPHNPNSSGYNVNFLNNGIPDKDIGKKTNSVGGRVNSSLGQAVTPATPTTQRKTRMQMLGRLFKPWKWKKKKKIREVRGCVQELRKENLCSDQQRRINSEGHPTSHRGESSHGPIAHFASPGIPQGGRTTVVTPSKPTSPLH